MTAERTTACLLTAPARGGIAVIVLAGPAVGGILDRVFRPRGRPPAAGGLSLGWIVRDGQTLDEAVVATGAAANRAEINIHGGPQVARAVLATLAEFGAEIVPTAGADPAFARPAEGLGNPAIAAEMLTALRSAVTPLATSAVTCQWSGGLSALVRGMLERPIDAACSARLTAAAEALPLMRRLLMPAEVAIAGPPNVGKSALANALAGRNVSIVSETAGTTRDWVRVLIDADGVPVWLTDTAGLWGGMATPGNCQLGGGKPEGPLQSAIGNRQSAIDNPASPCRRRSNEDADVIDAEAVRRAWQRIAAADLVLCVTAGVVGGHDTGRQPGVNDPGASRRERGGTETSCIVFPDDRDLVARVRALPDVLHLAGKCDMGFREDLGASGPAQPPAGRGGVDDAPPPGSAEAPLPVSGKTLAGIDPLRRAIRDRLGLSGFDPRDPMAFTDRQAGLLRAAADAARAGRTDDARTALGELLGA